MFKEALKIVGVQPRTFRKYAKKIGMVGEHVGHCTYYHRNGVETLRFMLNEGKIDVKIAEIERLTGQKVQLVKI